MVAVTPSRHKFVDRIRADRETARLSQTALAELVGRNQGFISRFETGQANPNLDTLLSLAAALDAELTLIPRKKAPEVERLLGRASNGNRPVSSVFEDVFIPDPTKEEGGDEC